MQNPVENFMTPAPHTVGAEQTLHYAEQKMHEHSIRHLPVLKGGELVGLVSLRDIRLVESIDKDLESVVVDEACSSDPVMVEKGTSLSDVSRQMAENKIGSVLVMDGNKLVGIFTWIDALRALIDKD